MSTERAGTPETAAPPQRHFDAVVMGAGPAGATAALHLQQRGWSVLLADAGRPRGQLGETLNPVTRLLLERLGQWEEFERAGHPPCHGARAVWGGPLESSLEHLFGPYGSAYFIDRAAFDSMLRAAAARAGAEVRMPASVELVSAPLPGSRGTFTLRLREGASPVTIEARYLVDATGRRASFARHCGARRRSDDTLMCAVLSVEADPRSLGSCGETFVEAVEYGFWYRAVERVGRATVGLFTDADLLARMGAHALPAWNALYERTRGHTELPIDGTARICAPLQVRSAAVGRLTQVVGERWIAAGDAALSLDPLSSRGITAAITGGLHAASALVAHRLGSTASLSEYARTIDQVHAQHGVDRRAYYGLEKRWPDAPFWSRRARPPQVPPLPASRAAQESFDRSTAV